MRYRVSVCRIGYACHDFEADAINKDDAAEKAKDMIGEVEFFERDADYEVDPGCDVEEIKASGV